MKAKLIKVDKDNYTLLDEKGIPIGTTPNVLSNNTFSKLSKQNCDEIFGVVDVDKLAEDFAKNYSIYPTAQDDTEYGFKNGFNKAMELNKDKVFTLEDMRKAFIAGSNVFIEEDDDVYGSEFEKEETDFIQSLQQPTEIEVEIEMEKIVDETKVIGAVKGVKGSGDKITTYKSVPKLDSEGCLILKQIK
jgi:hypothetical protein